MMEFMAQYSARNQTTYYDYTPFVLPLAGANSKETQISVKINVPGK